MYSKQQIPEESMVSPILKQNKTLSMEEENSSSENIKNLTSYPTAKIIKPIRGGQGKKYLKKLYLIVNLFF